MRPEHRRRRGRRSPNDGDFNGPVYALAADSKGTSTPAAGSATSRHCRRRQRRLLRQRGWHAMGTGHRAGRRRRRQLRAQPHRERDERVRRHRLAQHRRHPASRPRREVERLGLERPRLEHRRHRRLVPAVDLDQRADDVRIARLRRRARSTNANGDPLADMSRRVRREGVAARRLERRRGRPAERQRRVRSTTFDQHSSRAEASRTPAGTTSRTSSPPTRSPGAPPRGGGGGNDDHDRRPAARARRRRRPATRDGHGARERPAVHGGTIPTARPSTSRTAGSCSGPTRAP